MNLNCEKKKVYKKYLAAIIASTVTFTAAGCGNGHTPNHNEDVTEQETENNLDKLNIYSMPGTSEVSHLDTNEVYGTIFAICTKQSMEELSNMGIDLNQSVNITNDIQLQFMETSYDNDPVIAKNYQALYGDIDITSDILNKSLTRFEIRVISRNQIITDHNLYDAVIQPLCGDKLTGNIYMLGSPNIVPEWYLEQAFPNVTEQQEQGKKLKMGL